MILAVTLRASKRRPRSRRPDVLGFDVRLEEGRLSVPLLVVTRRTRARSVRAQLIGSEGAKERVQVMWPALAVGVHEDLTLEVTQ